MSYLIQYATEADAPALARINTQSFQNRRLLAEVFPQTSASTLQDYKAIVAMKHLANPQMHVLKVTDGEIAGYARWLIPEALGFGQTLPVLSEQAALAAKDPVPFAPRPMNEDIYSAFKGLLEAARKRHTTDQDMVLDLLGTLPAYQGRGVGSALLNWGTQKADAWKKRIYLEATPEGESIYRKHGWKPVEVLTMDFAPFGGVGGETFLVMIRDPVS